jgi:predicted nucleotidyltransferase component of viral defense system
MKADAHPISWIEQFHLLFLDQLGRKLDKHRYALKGGCNLRFYMRSIRYSEDMDLDVQSIPVDLLRERVEQILQGTAFGRILQARGMAISHHSAPKQTETTQRWKMTLEAKDVGLPLHTKVEFSRRGIGEPIAFEAVDGLLIREYRLTPILASHYPPEAAFRQKIHALIHRSQTQARDIFDLDLLLRSGVTPDSAPMPLEARRQAQENALSLAYDVFKSQVLSFLSPEYQAQYADPQVWEAMVMRVAEAMKGEAP